jgi:hypothetical protein
MILCKIDSNLVYAGVTAPVPANPKSALPAGYVLADPPAKTGIWQWAGNRWHALEKYPEPPPPPPKADKSKADLEAELDARGELKALKELIAEVAKAAK